MKDRFGTARPYAAAFMLIEQEGKYLFVKRWQTGWMDGYYGLPSGKVEKNEGFMQAAIREAEEEVGVIVRPEDVSFACAAWRPSEDSEDMEWCDVVFMAHKWSGNPHNAEPDMHEEIAWFSADELPDNVVPHIRALMTAISRGEHYIEPAAETQN